METVLSLIIIVPFYRKPDKNDQRLPCGAQWVWMSGLRWDRYLGPSLMFDFLQISAFFSNKSSNQAIVGQDFQRNLFGSERDNQQFNI